MCVCWHGPLSGHEPLHAGSQCPLLAKQPNYSNLPALSLVGSSPKQQGRCHLQEAEGNSLWLDAPPLLRICLF